MSYSWKIEGRYRKEIEKCKILSERAYSEKSKAKLRKKLKILAHRISLSMKNEVGAAKKNKKDAKIFSLLGPLSIAISVVLAYWYWPLAAIIAGFLSFFICFYCLCLWASYKSNLSNLKILKNLEKETKNLEEKASGNTISLS